MSNNDDFSMKGMIALIGVVMMAGVLQMVIPAQAEPEVTGYKCPYCSDAIFGTLEELIAHIAEAHPEQPPFVVVDIGWGD